MVAIDSDGDAGRASLSADGQSQKVGRSKLTAPTNPKKSRGLFLEQSLGVFGDYSALCGHRLKRLARSFSANSARAQIAFVAKARASSNLR